MIEGYVRADLDVADADELEDIRKEIRHNYRTNRNLDKAIEASRCFIDYLYSVLNDDERVTHKMISVAEYDLGYVQFMKADYSGAIDSYRNSKQNSLMAEDLLGAEIADTHLNFNLYLNGELSAEEAYEKAQSTLNTIHTIYQQSGNALAQSWIFNVHNRLLNYAVTIGDIEGVKDAHASMITSSFIADEIKDTDHPNFSNRMKLKLSITGKVGFAEKKYAEALTSFLSFLDIALPDYGHKHEQMSFDRLDNTGLAYDYYYAGKCLLGLNDISSAKHVFEEGLKLNPEDGNHFAHELIKVELKNLP